MITSAIRIEGGLFGPDILDHLLSNDLPGQKPQDFGLDARRSLTDEIAAVFAEARAQWGIFQQRLQRLAPGDLATTTTRDAWVIPFLSSLGYELTYNARGYDVEGQTFAISHRAGATDTAPPVHIVGLRQELGRVPPSGRPRMAPHSLVQEYLNRTEQVWGVVTNGLTLRVLRDSTFVRRQAYLEFDLVAIVEEQRFQDFAVLYRLLHRTRLPREVADVEASLLERYYALSQEQGGRVREHLRDGVEQCIEQLANGFLRHAGNGPLRQRVAAGPDQPDRITADALYRQLLRLVYRLLFLLVAEDRGLLGGEAIYREHYGIGRLRQLLEHDRRAAFTEHDDLWQSLRVLWQVLRDERLAAMLGLPVLNGELFDPQDLDHCAITNREFLQAFWHLAWYQEKQAPPRRVNYAALDVEELGSVYESLLEFHPAADPDSAGRPVFRLLSGSERKTTGSYYTPPQLVNELIVSALDPVIEDRLASRPKDREAALLSIRVCDPACGSGHFLLAAARRIGRALARVRSGADEPAPEAVREATRDVIAHGIYGVDKNPLAVDLCRVALWIESHTGDRPLTFLDHRIRCGDSLVGVFDLAALTKGIPDKAFAAFEGDDKEVAKAATALNRRERAGFRELEEVVQPGAAVADFGARSRAVDAIRDDSAEAIRRKKRLFEESHHDRAWQQQKDACDLWTAAFFQPLRAGEPVITSGALGDRMAGRRVDPRVQARATVIAEQQRVFHWPLEFPEVFADGGFDVVLSNPPWERLKVQEQEFFAARDARIATAPNKAAREALIRELPTSNPALLADFQLALRGASGSSSFMRQATRYPLTGRGDINTFAVFAELTRNLAGAAGLTGVVLPSSIAFADTTKLFFDNLMETGSLVSLLSFFEIRQIFLGTDSRDPFCLLTMTRQGRPGSEAAVFVFDARTVDETRRADKRFTLTSDEVKLLNPNTRTCPIFRSQADAELTKAVYRRVPILWQEGTDERPEVNPWRVSFARLFDMSTDSGHFRTADELKAAGLRLEGNRWVDEQEVYLPLYEAKMLHQFDHRFATYEGLPTEESGTPNLPQTTAEQKRDPSFVVQPRYWVEQSIVEDAVPKFPEPLAAAVKAGDAGSVRYVLGVWRAGFLLRLGERERAMALLAEVDSGGCKPATRREVDAFGRDLVSASTGLNDVYPLTPDQAERIAASWVDPIAVADRLLAEWSPKWFLGWRDIVRSGDERTLIASAVPRTAVGHKFMLAIARKPLESLGLLCLMNAHVADYCARQKLGAASFSYFVLKQLPFPFLREAGLRPDKPCADVAWWVPRALELVHTSSDISEVASDIGGAALPFVWDDERRFQIRCELDAAFFHLYLPSTADGSWQPARIADGDVVDETADHLAALTRHFPTPRHAVEHIMDTFPLVRKKDEEAHGHYRTKARILEIYDGMLEAQRTGRTWASPLDPPPGVRP